MSIAKDPRVRVLFEMMSEHWAPVISKRRLTKMEAAQQAMEVDGAPPAEANDGVAEALQPGSEEASLQVVEARDQDEAIGDSMVNAADGDNLVEEALLAEYLGSNLGTQAGMADSPNPNMKTGLTKDLDELAIASTKKCSGTPGKASPSNPKASDALKPAADFIEISDSPLPPPPPKKKACVMSSDRAERLARLEALKSLGCVWICAACYNVSKLSCGFCSDSAVLEK